MNIRRFLVLPIGFGIMMAGCAARPEPETLLPGQNVLPSPVMRTALTQTVDYATHVKPILRAKCVICHDSEAQPRGLHLESRAAAVKSGALGAYIVPGSPERSLLLTKITSAHAGIKAMPPVGERLTADEVRILQRWIKQGAQWPVSE